MFVSFTDREFYGNVDNAVEGIKANWAEMNEYGAINTRTAVTGENIPGTTTHWSSQELLDANVNIISVLGKLALGMSPASGIKGPLALELD